MKRLAFAASLVFIAGTAAASPLDKPVSAQKSWGFKCDVINERLALCDMFEPGQKRILYAERSFDSMMQPQARCQLFLDNTGLSKVSTLVLATANDRDGFRVFNCIVVR